jgi:hypothetical protein
MKNTNSKEEKQTKIASFFKQVYGGPGYVISSISKSDLDKLRSLVESQFRAVLSDIAGITDPVTLNVPITQYHTISENVEHGKLWGKTNRIFTKELLEKAMHLDFFAELKEELGEVLISDEEEIGYPEIYWRLVRPLPFIDVGPIHADAWFWDLGHGQTPKGHQRIKFWFSLYNEVGQNGFCFVPSSHTQQYEYQSEVRHGFAKPVFDETKYDLKIDIFKSSPGDFIIFNDKLLHGGKAGGTLTRISMEFTLFVKDEYLESIGISL